MNADTARHVRYARGYLELGMKNEASDELEAIAAADRFLPEVLEVRIAFHMEGRHWETVISVARELTVLKPENEQGWISWAYALRELGRIAEAKAVLFEAKPRHGGTSAVLHYNLACYHCLLGELAEARAYLATACRMHPPFKDEAQEDTDLEAIWDELKSG